MKVSHILLQGTVCSNPISLPMDCSQFFSQNLALALYCLLLQNVGVQQENLILMWQILGPCHKPTWLFLQPWLWQTLSWLHSGTYQDLSRPLWGCLLTPSLSQQASCRTPSALLLDQLIACWTCMISCSRVMRDHTNIYNSTLSSRRSMIVMAVPSFILLADVWDCWLIMSVFLLA